MKRSTVEVELSQEAVEEFEDIQRYSRGLYRDWARRYLEELAEFPDESWVDIRRRVEGDYFKSDNHVPFDIQGKIHYGSAQRVERVVVTRFRVKIDLASSAFNPGRDYAYVKNQVGG